jgi:transcriptional regulator with GAF, ATPase, and Fis domain
MQQTTTPSHQAYLIIQLGNRWTDVLRLLPEQSVLVGRSSENQVVVKDERVSRHHARISHHSRGWVVEDLGSRNGTQVNQRSIDEPLELQGGEVITVGGCRMTFTLKLAEAFPACGLEPGDEHDATRVIDQAAIVNRLSNSQYSSEIDPSILGANKASVGQKWSFFYRLVFDLVQCKTDEEAAGVALDRLLSELNATTGGVIKLDYLQATADNKKAKTPTAKTPADYRMAVLAARQSPGGSYHRISDFLAKTVIADQQAVLARNVQDDEHLSVARTSGQQKIASILVAPLRIRKEEAHEVIGLIHIYSLAEARMLTPDDLDLAVGVADNLAIAIQRLRESEQLNVDLDATRRKVDLLEQQLSESSELIGSSAPMVKVKQSIQRAGPTSATVLVRGESGSGKELVARAIHFASSRKSGPLVCLNCAALAPTLLESELFGHEKGSFTGATDRKIGKFEAANRGTLFLDEVGEMPPELQAKFLRVLEGHPFERLGGNSAIHTDVRVIAATNRDLEEAVKEKSFRSDLYFRLRVVEIVLPPLRQRPDDIPSLVEHFLNMFRQHANRRIAGIDPKALEALARHSWPGNVRELRNIIERAVVLGVDSTLGLEDISLPPLFLEEKNEPLPNNQDFQPVTLDELERIHILGMLEYAEGNKSKAAQLLGIERSTLDRKLKRFS